MIKKPKIKFHYGNDQDDDFHSVNSTHKGPIHYDNLYDTLTNPTYDQITLDYTRTSPQNVEIVESKAQIMNVALADAIAKSQKNTEFYPQHATYVTETRYQSSNSPQEVDNRQTGSFKKQTDKVVETQYRIFNDQGSYNSPKSTSPKEMYITGGQVSTKQQNLRMTGGEGHTPPEKQIAQVTYVTGGSGYNKAIKPGMTNTAYTTGGQIDHSALRNTLNSGYQDPTPVQNTLYTTNHEPGESVSIPHGNTLNSTNIVSNSANNVQKNRYGEVRPKEEKGCFGKKDKKQVGTVSPRRPKSHSSESFSSSDDQKGKRDSCLDSKKKNHNADRIRGTNQTYETYPDEPQSNVYSNIGTNPNSNMTPIRQTNNQLESSDGAIRITSPSFKYNPQTAGEMRAGKKNYVKAEKQQKYLYTGIPEKKESDFVGCFGCCAPKTNTYKIQAKK